ncbi:hypothetical protein KP509_06G007900 [Ceratopteris richardii]|uniref:Uncharacterized protein n=1 Tax=Ceratopteris richardii TaxID=49495 RepID=A0A8T2UPV6_CERRI|nr:hypothetical protein KP509_06G007900 [Ceratopteris richardii]
MWKCHKKPNYKYYKVELEKKKNKRDKKKKDTKNEAHDSSKDKDKEKANVTSSVVIEELSNAEDILCIGTVHLTLNGTNELVLHDVSMPTKSMGEREKD